MSSPRQLIASVDMGSSSFRMIVARVEELNGQSQIYVVDSLREPVRLGAGLDSNKRLDEPSQARALAALQRFGERLRSFEPHQVRAVATNAVRVARNAAEFIAKAEAALGFPIDVISGVEEARLVYCGVAHQLPIGQGKRLVVDIGGGSTEFIIGEDYEPEAMESLYIGCVSTAQAYFADGSISGRAMKNAIMAARKEVAVLRRQILEMGWTHAIGSSGTARALAEICVANGFTEHGMSAEALAKIREHVVLAGHLDAITLEGLKVDR
ncbi:MAG TPA: Ppx/GppA family phosphatase, partial [Limnobacter sp.]|nr:Ppx/GppA family phosphatase [Limnobacter sp.]